jgi:anti-sigma regulatory factor (Ser/Thr protein kinase)
MTGRPLRSASSRAGGTDWHWLTSALEIGATAGGNGSLMTDLAPSDRARGPRTATRTPGADARSVRETRDFTLATLRRWDVADRLDDIVIVVSELLTNAISHARPAARERRVRWPIRLDLLQSGPCVLCMVADPSDQPPVQRDPGCLAEAGRGLQIIAALSDQWGFTTPNDMGKVVWAMFSTKPGSML